MSHEMIAIFMFASMMLMLFTGQRVFGAIGAIAAIAAIALWAAAHIVPNGSIWGGTIFMRPDDHQAIQNVHIMAHTDEGVTHDSDNSGYGLVVESSVEMAALDSATSCKMKRP